MKCLFWIFLLLMLTSIGIALVWLLRGTKDDDDGEDY
jgi:hypothetical protein